jgi:predicted alpha/beta-fold hydrolase
VRAVVTELLERDRLPEVFAAGFSMGGNLVLKMAREFGHKVPPGLRGVAALCPSIDLAACADSVGEPRNFIYEWHFVTSLKRRMRYKARLFPERYPLDGIGRVRSVREFDDVITARFCGFRDADDYYARSSAGRVLAAIRIPTLVLTAQDDPMVPYAPFLDPALQSNPNITVIAPRHGGHCAFVARDSGEERFWAEARIVEFCEEQSQRVAAKAGNEQSRIDVNH